jgi:TonB family protein
MPTSKRGSSGSVASPAIAAKPATVDERAASNAAVVARYYPKSALGRGEEGDVLFRIGLNKLGEVESCTVTGSSGYADLDTATCDLMVEHAVFGILRDTEGWKVATVNDGQVSWRLPPGAPRPMVPPPHTGTAGSQKIACRREVRNDSFIIGKKICLTEREWQQQYELARRQTIDMQMSQGPMPH